MANYYLHQTFLLNCHSFCDLSFFDRNLCKKLMEKIKLRGKTQVEIQSLPLVVDILLSFDVNRLHLMTFRFLFSWEKMLS